MDRKTVVLVTGTSRGIGRKLSQTLRDHPEYIVYGSSRKGDPSDPHHLSLDVTDPRSCSRAVQSVIAEQGRIDVLINNAGSHLTGASEETSLEEIRRQMELNFYGAVRMIKSVTPLMLEQKSGKILNMSSLGGRLSLPFTSAYNASKFALEGYTEALRLELLPFGIYVSNLVPAYVDTQTVDQSILSPERDHPLFQGYRKALHDKMLDDSRNGVPMDSVANTVLRILRNPRPGFRYRLGRMSHMLTRINQLVPERTFQDRVLKSFGIPSKIEY